MTEKHHNPPLMVVGHLTLMFIFDVEGDVALWRTIILFNAAEHGRFRYSLMVLQDYTDKLRNKI